MNRYLLLVGLVALFSGCDSETEKKEPLVTSVATNKDGTVSVTDAKGQKYLMMSELSEKD